MGNFSGIRQFAAVGVVASLLSAIPAGSQAAPGARQSFNPRDFTGVYMKRAGESQTFSGQNGNIEPPLQKRWLDYMRKVLERKRLGQRVWDPTNKCLPPGVPRIIGVPDAKEFLMTPYGVLMVAEYFSEVRRIYTDGRSFPAEEDLNPTFDGLSIGKWEGDTLVVETRGLRVETVLDSSGVPHTDQLRVTERFRKTGPNDIEIAVTVVDPTILTEPYGAVWHYVRVKPDYVITEYVCADGVVESHYESTPEDAIYNRNPDGLVTKP